MDEYRQRIGFAIGTGLVPGVVMLLAIGITSGRWTVAVIAGIAFWAIIASVFWGRANKGRRS